MPDNVQPRPTFPPLDTGCKQRFPFRLACPSFVYPADYTDNVRHLGPFVDEIQLLFFESHPPRSLPSLELIRELSELADSQAITYNIHLPSDIYPGHPDPKERRRAADALRKVLERCAVLEPSTYTLHLNRNPDDLTAISIAHWQENLLDTIDRMLPSDMDRRLISIETLDYPFDQVAPVITASDLSVCMDMGHLMVHDVDITAFYQSWQDRITVVHLHGVDGTTDHLPLDRLSAHRMLNVLNILQSFSGVVSLEVYSHKGLNASLAHLVDHWFGLNSEGM